MTCSDIGQNSQNHQNPRQIVKEEQMHKPVRECWNMTKGSARHHKATRSVSLCQVAWSNSTLFSHARARHKAVAAKRSLRAICEDLCMRLKHLHDSSCQTSSTTFASKTMTRKAQSSMQQVPRRSCTCCCLGFWWAGRWKAARVVGSYKGNLSRQMSNRLVENWIKTNKCNLCTFTILPFLPDLV